MNALITIIISGTCTFTPNNGWWKVDLEDTFLVEKIEIRNRIDCCSERIDGLKVCNIQYSYYYSTFD